MTLSRIASVAIAFMIYRKLRRPFKEWDAFKLGIIDEKGKKVRDPETEEEKSSFTVLDSLVALLKRKCELFMTAAVFGFMLRQVVILRESESNYGELKRRISILCDIERQMNPSLSQEAIENLVIDNHSFELETIVKQTGTSLDDMFRVFEEL